MAGADWPSRTSRLGADLGGVRPRAKVTVLMAVHNGARFIGHDRQRAWADLRDFELPSWRRLHGRDRGVRRAYDDRRIKCVANERNLGLACSLNVSYAGSGSVVIRLDHDDASRADRLARQVTVLDEEPDRPGRRWRD